MKFYKPLLVLGSFFLLAGCAQQEKLTSISLDPEADKVLVNTDTDIRITTDPKNIQLIDSDFATLGANISVDKDNAEFSASKPGVYTVKASKNGITSNTVKITVVQEKSELAQVTVPKKQTKPTTEENVVNETQNDVNIQVNEETDSTQIPQTSAPSQDISSTAPSQSGTSQNDASQSTQPSSSSDDSQTKDDQTSQNDQKSNTYVPPKADPNALDPATVLKDPDQYVGQSLTLVGDLNAKGTALDGLDLTGLNVKIHSVPAQLTGTLEKQSDGSYVLDVNSYAQVQ